MPSDAAPNETDDKSTDDVTTDDDVIIDDKGGDDDIPKESDGGFEDFLNNALGDDLDDNDPDGDSDDADDDSDLSDDKDNKDDKSKVASDGDDVIDVDDVLVDDDDEDDPKPNPMEAQVTALLKQNEQLMAMVTASKKEPDPEPEPDVDIFEDDSFGEMAEILELDDAGKKVLQGFLTKLVDHTQKSSVNQMLQETPNVVGKVMDSKTQIETVKVKFYTENAELAAVKPFVSQLASTVAKENPAMDMAAVLEETSKRAYQVLGITKKKPVGDDKKGKDGDPDNPDAGGDKDKKKKPAFANKKGARKPPVKKSKLDSDLDDMLKTEF